MENILLLFDELADVIVFDRDDVDVVVVVLIVVEVVVVVLIVVEVVVVVLKKVVTNFTKINISFSWSNCQPLDPS